MKLSDIVLGGKITIYSRQYKVADFEDDYTRRALGNVKQKTFGLITSQGVASGCIGRVWAAVDNAGMKIVNARMITLSAADAASLGSGLDAGTKAGARAIAMEIHGEDANTEWKRLRDHLEEAGAIAAGDVGVASTPDHEERLRHAVFGPPEGRLASAQEVVGAMSECTCVIVLPSAVAKGLTGRIIEDLLQRVSNPASSSSSYGYSPSSSLSPLASASSAAGGAGIASTTASAAGGRGGVGSSSTFGGGGATASTSAPIPASAFDTSVPLVIGALGVYDVDRRCAEEMLEVYKHVVPDFADYAAELSSGPCVAIELVGPDAVNRVREVAGPRSVEVAQRIRPHTLRAKYGTSSAKPALHCTDLVEDGPVECEYMFSLLPQP